MGGRLTFRWWLGTGGIRRPKVRRVGRFWWRVERMEAPGPGSGGGRGVAGGTGSCGWDGAAGATGQLQWGMECRAELWGGRCGELWEIELYRGRGERWTSAGCEPAVLGVAGAVWNGGTGRAGWTTGFDRAHGGRSAGTSGGARTDGRPGGGRASRGYRTGWRGGAAGASGTGGCGRDGLLGRLRFDQELWAERRRELPGIDVYFDCDEQCGERSGREPDGLERACGGGERWSWRGDGSGGGTGASWHTGAGGVARIDRSSGSRGGEWRPPGCGLRERSRRRRTTR